MPAFKFIVFEGIDGSGKSTQSKLLSQWFQEQGLPCCHTFEPTDNFIGSQIRNILTKKTEGHPITIANLFAADRYDHLTNEVYGLIHLLSRNHVVCDRYLLSSYAYQSLDAPIEWIKTINKYNEALLWPDITFYIKIDTAAALERIRENRNQTDLFETKNKLEQISANYAAAIAGLTPEQQKKVYVIDGTEPIDTIFRNITAIVEEHIS